MTTSIPSKDRSGLPPWLVHFTNWETPMTAHIVQISDYLPPPAQVKSKSGKKRQKSQFELYPLPFFDRGAPCRTWTVAPTGNYGDDCKTGAHYAIEFLRTCDGSVGWAALMAQIVADMIRAGPSGTFADGQPKVNGIVIGFISTLGNALAYCYKGDRAGGHHAHDPASA